MCWEGMGQRGRAGDGTEEKRVAWGKEKAWGDIWLRDRSGGVGSASSYVGREDKALELKLWRGRHGGGGVLTEGHMEGSKRAHWRSVPVYDGPAAAKTQAPFQANQLGQRDHS